MKSIIIFCAAVLSFGFAKAQTVVYDNNAQVRNVAAFSGVDVGGGITVYLSQGKEQAVAVSAEDVSSISKIITEVHDGILKIHVDAKMWNGWNWKDNHIKAYVTVTQLNSLDLSGGSIGKVTDEISSTDLHLILSGGCILEGKFTGTNLKTELSGGSIATLSGTFTNASVEASGGSILKGYDADLSVCKVEASGGSIVDLTVTKELNVEANGGSIVDYKGNGVLKQNDTSGGSIVKKKDS